MALKPVYKKILKWSLYGLLTVFVLMNIVAFFHAWKFSHFNPDNKHRIVADSLTKGQKINMMLFGADIPRPLNTAEPTDSFTTIKLQSNKEIECWYIPADSAKGTVIIFHGYGDSKCRMLGRQQTYTNAGYNVLLMDFMGGGGSEGNTCTIGYLEAQQVKTCVEYIQKQGEKNIHLVGISMGAAAVLKAMNDYQLPIKSIIVECPFGSLRTAIKNRFELMGTPSFPMADMLLFWGSVQTGCNLFNHCPADYAKAVKVPTLVLWGEQDDKVMRFEIDDIFNNLQGPKKLITYPKARHESYRIQYAVEYDKDVKSFLENPPVK